MNPLSKDEKIELNRILNSVQGRLDEKLIKFTLELVFKTNVRASKEDFRLYSANIQNIPSRSIHAFSLGSFFGQTYQISLDIAKKMNLKLKFEQKRILREFVFFIVLLKFEKESKTN
jgi:hypothetical protein